MNSISKQFWICLALGSFPATLLRLLMKAPLRPKWWPIVVIISQFNKKISWKSLKFIFCFRLGFNTIFFWISKNPILYGSHITYIWSVYWPLYLLDLVLLYYVEKIWMTTTSELAWKWWYSISTYPESTCKAATLPQQRKKWPIFRQSIIA